MQKGSKGMLGGRGGHIEALGVRTWHWAWCTAGHFGDKDTQELSGSSFLQKKTFSCPELLTSSLID